MRAALTQVCVHKSSDTNPVDNYRHSTTSPSPVKRSNRLICAAQQLLAIHCDNFGTAFARRRSLVRAQHRPLGKYRTLQVEPLQDDRGSGNSLISCAATRRDTANLTRATTTSGHRHLVAHHPQRPSRLGSRTILLPHHSDTLNCYRSCSTRRHSTGPCQHGNR